MDGPYLRICDYVNPYQLFLVFFYVLFLCYICKYLNLLLSVLKRPEGKTLSAVHEIKYAKVTLAFDDFKCYKKVQHILSYHNKHDKSSRSPGPSCTFWAPESIHFAWNSYTAVYSSLCSAPDQLFVLHSWFRQNRFASVEVSLTILKTETTQTEYRQKDRIQKDRYTGLVIESVPD